MVMLTNAFQQKFKTIEVALKAQIVTEDKARDAVGVNVKHIQNRSHAMA